MLVQDTLTGYLHEVPDTQLYEPELAEFPEQFAEGQVIYDGLGNPVGALPFLLPFIPKIAALAAKAIPAITQAIPAITRAIPQVGQLVSRFLPGGIPAPVPGAPAPGLPRWPAGLPLPAGWTRPLSPLMARAPRRLYMRCSVWPGPPGLVPISAAQAPAGAVAPPGFVAPQAAAAAAAAQQAAAMGMMRRRRFVRRRR